MENKGEEFLRKVQEQQDDKNLYEDVEHLKSDEPAAYVETSQNFQENMQKEQELTNIMLEESIPNNEENKKKYLVLGLMLIILFLTTILMIRLLNDDDSNQNDFNEEQKKNAVKSESSIDEEYKKILENRVNRQVTNKEEVKKEPVKEVEEKVSTEKAESIDEKMDSIINKISNKNVEEKASEPVRKSPFIRKDNSTYTPPKKVYKPVEKKVVKAEPKKEIFTSSTNKPRGYFIQVGAFSKKPSNNYIQKIKNANFKYTIYKVEVKGRHYNKVLVGPYSSKAKANADVSKVKNSLNISSAYVLKL